MSDSGGITLSLDGGGRKKRGDSTATPMLVLALECSAPHALSARYSLAGVSAVHLGRGRERTAERSSEGASELAIRVADRWMSSRHARIDHSFGRWILQDEGSKNGTIVNGELVARAVLNDGDVFELGHTFFVFREAVELHDDDPRDVDLSNRRGLAEGLDTLIPAFARELAKLVQVAESQIPILIQGESGTGKEVLARAVHQLSRREGEFVAVNCGAIAPNLVESELFGHQKGAFSGAVENRAGLVRAANRGTLFLDEIGDLPPSSQAALLRVLQEREVLPVGGTKPIPVDLRVVAATHRDLDTLVVRGTFRQDLFARLTGFRVIAPPLRERLDDLGLLIATLYQKATAAAPGGGFEPDSARMLFRNSWPMNIRELEQVLATAAVLAKGEAIALEHLPDNVRMPPPATDRGGPITSDLTEADRELKDELIGQLSEHKGNVSAIARAMGKDRKQIQRWLKRFGLTAGDFRR